MDEKDYFSLETDEFKITINSLNGGICSFMHPKDKFNMNWVEGENTWGKIQGNETSPLNIQVSNNECTAEYKIGKLYVTVRRGFDHNGMFFERYSFKNITEIPQTFGEGDIGVFTTFNDNYQDALTCNTKRCHTHIWCGENVSYIYAIRMGGYAPHLGLVLIKGSLSGYSVQRNLNSDDRGDFILHPSTFTLNPQKSYELSWVMFWHDGSKDFFEKAQKIPGFIKISAKEYSVFKGEIVSISAEAESDLSDLQINENAVRKELVNMNKRTSFEFMPDIPGEYKIVLTKNLSRTFVRVNVLLPLKDIIEARCRFITKNQQYMDDTESPLFGSYLIYDNESHEKYYSQKFDHNAGRERVGMGVLIAMFLQNEGNNSYMDIMKSLELYDEFIKRELYDEETGIVYNDVNRNNIDGRRLYNYPWVAVFQLEMFKLKRDARYLKNMVRTIKAYYRNGGHKFYCVGMPMFESISVLKEQGMLEESDELLALYCMHVDEIVKIGTNYPPHEVSYEQTIVAPAACYTTEAYLLTGQKKYLEAANEHIKLLSLYNGEQPDFHLNNIAISHWDGFWFGKRMTYGDTFPHYWSTLTAVAYKNYYKATGNTKYNLKANSILRNNLCLFDGNGFGSCAYLYALSNNGSKGRFFDPWANDQDWALVYAMKFMEL